MNINAIKKEFGINKKHLLSLVDYSTKDIENTINLAIKLKIMLKEGQKHNYLDGKTLGMIFTKSSTRTRVSFEVGMQQLGGYPLFLSSNDIQLGRGESISDTANVLSRYLDGIMIRTFKQSDVEDLAKHGTIPIINGLTDLYHPCQIIADLMTIYEKKNTLSGLKLTFIGDGNNIANSLLLGCSKMGMDISIACPKGYEPDEATIKIAIDNSKKNSSIINITNDPYDAIKNADAVYSDVWASMGQEDEAKDRFNVFKEYQINSNLFSKAKQDALFLHCLPAHRGEEVTSDVIDGKNSVIFDEAENRLHAQKAIMTLLLG